MSKAKSKLVMFSDPHSLNVYVIVNGLPVASYHAESAAEMGSAYQEALADAGLVEIESNIWPEEDICPKALFGKYDGLMTGLQMALMLGSEHE